MIFELASGNIYGLKKGYTIIASKYVVNPDGTVCVRPRRTGSKDDFVFHDIETYGELEDVLNCAITTSGRRDIINITECIIGAYLDLYQDTEEGLPF